MIFVRRLVKDPEVYRQAKAEEKTEAPRSSTRSSPPACSGLPCAPPCCTGALGGYYAITSWLPTFLKNERGLSVLGTGGYLAMVIVGSYVGYVVSAYLSDLLGRKKNFILFAVGSFVIVLLYTQMQVSDGVMLWLGFPLGFFASGIFSGMGAFLTELFPLMIGVLGQKVPLGLGIGVFSAVSYGVVILAALSLPETRGKQLQAR
ncbi:hypothetical protein PspTeo4_25688 [Pseudomonas sp. Teo4]|nr:hypothetical protein [Pseudomonas sp. Teo4]